MTTKEMIEVMQAYEDGKAIQFVNKDEDNWQDMICEPIWDWPECNYRVKSESEYVPYDSIYEVEKDKWFKGKKNGALYRVMQLDPSDDSVNMAQAWLSLKELFERYTYEDGTPCGKLVEE